MGENAGDVLLTPMLKRSAAHLAPELPTEEVVKRFGDAHPLKRVGTSEEVAELAAFLASDKASFCTRADYKVDGGLLAKRPVLDKRIWPDGTPASVILSNHPTRRRREE